MLSYVEVEKRLEMPAWLFNPCFAMGLSLIARWVFLNVSGREMTPLEAFIAFLCCCPLKIGNTTFSLFGGDGGEGDIFSLFSLTQAGRNCYSLVSLNLFSKAEKNAMSIFGLNILAKAHNEIVVGLGANIGCVSEYGSVYCISCRNNHQNLCGKGSVRVLFGFNLFCTGCDISALVLGGNIFCKGRDISVFCGINILVGFGGKSEISRSFACGCGISLLSKDAEVCCGISILSFGKADVGYGLSILSFGKTEVRFGFKFLFKE